MDFFSWMLAPFSHPIILGVGTFMFLLLGWLWYSPITPIGKVWSRYFPIPDKEHQPNGKEMTVMILLQFFMGAIITHTVIALWLFLIMHDMDKLDATLWVIKMYMGFVFIKDIGHWYFEKKPFPLVLIGVGYYLVGILGVCTLLTYFL